MRKLFVQTSVSVVLAFAFALALTSNVSAQDGKCRSLAKDPQSRCLNIQYPEPKEDWVVKTVTLDTAIVFFSSSAIDVMEKLGNDAVEDWNTYLKFGKAREVVSYEDKAGKPRTVYVTGNRDGRILEIFVIEESGGELRHWALTNGGKKFAEVGAKNAGVTDKAKEQLGKGAEATKKFGGKLADKFKKKP